MDGYRYVIVGGGMAADAAVEGIRGVDADGSVVVLSADADPPYSRPPLSKGLWKGADEETVWRGTADKGAEVRTETRVTSVDPGAKRVVDGTGTEVGYETLLLATGGTPRRLPFGGDDILYFRTFRDYRRLRELADSGERFAVIGAGFIGSEIAAALRIVGKEVAEIFPQAGIGARAYPDDIARFLVDYYREQGVEMLPEDGVTAVERRDGRIVVSTESGRKLEADAVVAGIGIEPNVELAEAAGIAVDDGVLVDEMLRTDAPGVFAVGDIASYPDPTLGRRRVEHEDAALSMGRHAGANMARQLAGAALEPYTHLPFFYTDMFDAGYEAVGDLDASLETVTDWVEPHGTGVVYYLAGGRVRGVLLWNVWGKVDDATELVRSGERVAGKDLIGRIRP